MIEQVSEQMKQHLNPLGQYDLERGTAGTFGLSPDSHPQACSALELSEQQRIEAGRQYSEAAARMHEASGGDFNAALRSLMQGEEPAPPVVNSEAVEKAREELELATMTVNSVREFCYSVRSELAWDYHTRRMEAARGLQPAIAAGM